MSNFPAGQQKRGPFRPLSRRHQGGGPPSRPHTRLPQAGVPLFPSRQLSPSLKCRNGGLHRPFPNCKGPAVRTAPTARAGPLWENATATRERGLKRALSPFPSPHSSRQWEGEDRQSDAPISQAKGRLRGISPPQTASAEAQRGSGRRTRPGFLSEEPLQGTAAPLPPNTAASAPLNGASPHPAANSSPRQISAPSARILRRRAGEPPSKSPLCLSRKISPASNAPHLSRNRRKRPPQRRAAPTRR